MKTITPFELQMLIDQSYVELIDVRPKKDFEEMHVLVARSIPLRDLKPHSLLAHRRADKNVPFYIIGDTEAEASLAACALISAGSPEPIILKGGVHAWNAQSLPVACRHRSRIPHVEIPTAAIVAVATLCVASLFHRAFLIAALVGFALAMPHFFRYCAAHRTGDACQAGSGGPRNPCRKLRITRSEVRRRFPQREWNLRQIFDFYRS